MKRGGRSFEQVSGNRYDGAGEPWAKQRAGIAPVKEANPDAPCRLLRTNWCHPENSTPVSAFANAPNVMTSVAVILVQVTPVIDQLSAITPYFSLVTLSNVLTNLVTVLSDIATVRPNFMGVLTQILAFRACPVLVAAPVSHMSGRRLRARSGSAREGEYNKSCNCFSVHTFSQLQVAIDHRRVIRAAAGKTNWVGRR
ncbi:MAG: hypothetical protein ABJC63_05570 [Gemmatimonadales bacterium]